MVSTQEVEAALTRRDDVADAIVVGTARDDGGIRLVAYVVPSGGAAPSPRELRVDLAGRLASHLVPGKFVLIHELPRTNRGKVDRAALPAPTGARPPFRAPQSARGQGTAKAFEQVLGIEPVGLDDDFFDLGGDSLAAVELLAALSQRFGVELPTSTLLECATVDELSKRLVSGRGRDAPTVLQIRDGWKRPFFCVCGGGATALALHWLGQALDQERPLYGVQARGLDERARPDRTVEAAARRHLDEIRAIQASGPYIIGGHSFGGMVAYQIARELRAAGEDTLLVLLDAEAPKGQHAGAKRMAENFTPAWMLARLRLRAALLTAGVVPRRHDRQYQLFYGLAGRLGDRYHPEGRFEGRTLLLRRSERLSDPQDLGWSGLLVEPPEIVAVTGGHEAMLRAPYVTLLAAAIDSHLESFDRGWDASLSSADPATSGHSPLTERAG
jgi:thioesterase domain-containing protein/acyl carrier protein